MVAPSASPKAVVATQAVEKRTISETKIVEKIPDEIRFIQRYVADARQK